MATPTKLSRALQTAAALTVAASGLALAADGFNGGIWGILRVE